MAISRRRSPCRRCHHRFMTVPARADIAYPAAAGRTLRGLRDPVEPHVIVLFGATGDLSRRKLLPGLTYLALSSLTPDIQIVGTSLDEIDDEEFRNFAHEAVDEVRHPSADRRAVGRLRAEAPLRAAERRPRGAGARRSTEAEQRLGERGRRLHYLSVPPKAAVAVISMLRDAGLVDRARVVMEKPFGTDLRSAVELNRHGARDVLRGADLPDRPLPRQGAGAQHPRVPVRQRAVRADLEPQLHRPRPDRRPRDARPGQPGRLLRGHRRVQGHGRHPPVPGHGVRGDGTADGARAAGHQRGEEQGLPLAAADRAARRSSAASTRATASETGVSPDSDTETFIALKADIDNWRWAGVPFYLRTGKRMAEGMRIISIAFREAPRAMFPQGSGVGDRGPRPPHLRPRGHREGVAVVLRQATRARA